MAEKPEVPTSSHFTPLERKNPATGRKPEAGNLVVTGELLTGGDTARGPSSHVRRGSVPGDDRRQTSISLQVVGRTPPALPYDYVLGSHRASAA